MTTHYHIYKAILAGLELNLTGMSLFDFVRGVTDCELELFEEIYEEIMAAWNK